MNKQHALCRATGKTSHLLQLCWRGFVFVDLLIISSVLHASNDINPYADMDIESLLNVEIVTASKYSQKQSESASSTTVIDKQQIKLFGYRTLADALRSVPGFFVVNDGTYQNVGVRGFDQSSSFNARMLIMIDGIRINSGIYDDGFAGSQLPLDIDLVERIEVLRGPSSSMYGNNAFFAVINLITRNGKEFQGGELAGSYSSFDTFKGRASYGRKHTNGLEYLISATGLNSEGPALKFPGQASANNPSGLTQDTNYEYNRQVFAKAHWGDFSFEGGYGPTKKGNPGAPYGVNFNDPNSFSTDREAFANLQYDKVLEPKLNLIARAFYGDYDFTGGYPYGSIMNYSKAHSWWSGFESRLVSTYFDRHSLIAGIEVTEFWMQNQSAFDLNPYALYSQDTRDSHRIGIYLQDDFTVTKQLKLSLGARVDDNSLVKKLMFSPRIGLIYQPFTATLLRLQYGKAFRAPNVSEQFQAYAPVIADDGSVTKGLLANPSLQPEQIETYELSIEQAIAKEWRFVATGYYMNLTNFITFQTVSDVNEQQVNGKNQNGYGGEFELRRQWANGVLLRTGYSLQYAKNQDGSNILNIPHHAYQLNLMTPLFTPEWHGGVEMQTLSSRENVGGKISGYTRLNLSLLYNPIKAVDLSASVYDILGDLRLEPATNGLTMMPQEGRTFRLKLAYRF